MSQTPDQEFAAYVASMESVEGGKVRRDGKWWYYPAHPFTDFNREIAGPGVSNDFPDGAIGIRADDDFWLVALLPPRFLHLDIGELVAVLWPAIENPTLNPDVSYRPPVEET